MRRAILRNLMRAAIATCLLLGTGPAFAGPICFNQDAQAVRCDAKDAMPVGWKPTPETWKAAQLPGPGLREVLQVVAGICALLALIALLPEFDGSKSTDWDRQEDDERR